MSDYISLSDIPMTTEDDIYSQHMKNISTIPVYQVQCLNNEIKVINIGELIDLCDIEINSFVLFKIFNCTTLNCIYDIKRLNESDYFDIIKIIIQKDNTKIAELSLCFKPSAQYTINISLSGRLLIILKYQSKTVLIEDNVEYESHDRILTKLYEWLSSEQVFMILYDQMEK